MKRFIIERNVPGASELTLADLVEIAKTSCRAVESLGVPYNWVVSYVAGDKIYCVHEAGVVSPQIWWSRWCTSSTPPPPSWCWRPDPGRHAERCAARGPIGRAGRHGKLGDHPKRCRDHRSRHPSAAALR